eukprot:CAMPEP_0115838166 /NCGR_PEP_ID=MMETSP0287-20121206/5588_1 /TAXON_ID=412157 /ORGANISM="Chrysochromulina rotalis, Strain UIO044" /LENGTH=497 /DNA_ID=CAMNT_0003291683 /DNA_START=4 /DNA_END=1494 /DNA_ORIENTATION=+
MSSSSSSLPRGGANTAFWDAAHQGDLPRMRECIAEDPEIVNKHPPKWKSAYQPTALAYAVWGNKPAAVRLLLESGADPNLADADSNYHPLHWASYKSDHAECAQLLVDAGADVNVKTARGFTPLEMATGHNNVVSAKPGVAAVLEDAARRPRPPWSSATPHAAPLPSGASSPPMSSVTSPTELPDEFNGRSRSERNSRDLAWSPLAAAQEAAEKAASSSGPPTPNTGSPKRVSPTTHVPLPYQRGSVSGSASAPELPRLPPSSVTMRAAWTNEALTVGAKSSRGGASSGLSGEGHQRLHSKMRLLLHLLGCVALSAAAGYGYVRWHAPQAGAMTLPSQPAGAAESGLSGPGIEGEAREASVRNGAAAAMTTMEAGGSRWLESGGVFALTLVVLLVTAWWLGWWRASPQASTARSPKRTAPPMPPKDTPSQFICPITGEVMRDPVTTADGHTFERSAIERWLITSDISPMTGTMLAHKQVAPAIALRQLIHIHMAAAW